MNGVARSRTHRRRAALAVLLCALIALAACASAPYTGPPPHPLPQPPLTAPGPSASHPNVVFVLTDDLSWNLIKFMPNVRALEQDGMTFTNYTVTDSLCCPSRASILTGKFPHDTHVLENSGPNGGMSAFYRRHDESSTFANSLFDHGYRTGFAGKYLNGYDPYILPTNRHDGPSGAYVPPGWSWWNGVGFGGYQEYNYAIASGHSVEQFRHSPSDYLTSVMQKRGLRFLQSNADAHTPFLLELATFAPHSPDTPAPQDVGTFKGLRAPRPPDFNRLPSPAPQWLAGRPPLDAAAQARLDHIFEKRVEAVQAVDRMVGALRSRLRIDGLAKKTVFVFSSDNGLHLGDYRLKAGKLTAFDTDVRVPLIIAGPGIRPGSTSSAVTENIDLRPTFEQLAGAPLSPTEDGHSLVPLLHGRKVPWRTVAGIEHNHPVPSPDDPDRQGPASGNPPSYDAIRAAKWIYIRYSTGDREYYDLAKDPYELHNLGPSLSPARVAALDTIVDRLTTCHGAAACWQASLPTRR